MDNHYLLPFSMSSCFSVFIVFTCIKQPCFAVKRYVLSNLYACFNQFEMKFFHASHSQRIMLILNYFL